jgi:hypothetical protein
MSMSMSNTNDIDPRGPESFCNCHHLSDDATCWYCAQLAAIQATDPGGDPA